jgi:hypothetical protein
MLNKTHPTVYNNSENKEKLWTQGYVLFARLKNHMVNFTKARKVNMDMRSNAKHVVLLKTGNTITGVKKSVLLNMKDGVNVIQKKFLKIKELITKEIEKRFWINSEKQEKTMGMHKQKRIEKEIERKLIATILSDWQLNLTKSAVLNHVKNVKFIVSHKLTTMIIQSLLKSFGFVVNVMGMSIEHINQRERLNLETSKEDAIVQTTEETCRGELEAVPPPRNWSVSLLWLKVIARLRHTAGCSFDDIDEDKSSLIDLEAYDYAMAA